MKWRNGKYISIHAPRGGSDNGSVSQMISNLIFQSTLPVGGATSTLVLARGKTTDFNPRSPWGERHFANPFFRLDFYFNPRSPWGERLP